KGWTFKAGGLCFASPTAPLFSNASPEPGLGAAGSCSHPRKIQGMRKSLWKRVGVYSAAPPPALFTALRGRMCKGAIKHALGMSSLAFLPVTAPLKYA
ncbi:uncharacterized, partial [Tachysurus ichikawai]